SRVLFGTDMGMDKGMYQNWWRLLESDDEYFEGRVWWRYYGLELPDSVLQALYHDNAKRIMNWTTV
ncbi:MAG TPA: amidohydrolase, partial [Chryseosolibacter sp.]